MFDIGWSELLRIGIVALIVVGPKELPGLFRTAGRYMGKARGMAREFQRSMEAAADDAGLGDAAKSLKALDRLNLNAATSSARKYAEGMVTEARSAVDEARAAGATPAAVKPTVRPTVKPAAGAGVAPAADPGPAVGTPDGADTAAP